MVLPTVINIVIGYTGLHGYVMEQLSYISEAIFGVETESGLKIAPSRNFEPRFGFYAKNYFGNDYRYFYSNHNLIF